jgi:signal transduction histidine kinase
VVEVGYQLRTRDWISSDQLAMLKTFMDYVAVAIEQARLFEETAQHREMLTQLHHVSHDVASARHPDEVLRSVGKALKRVLDADIVMIYRYDSTAQTIEPPRVFGEVLGRHALQSAPLDRGIVAEILRTARPHYAADALQDPILREPFPPLKTNEKRGKRRTFTERQNIKSFAGVPMLVNDEAQGVLCVNYRRRHAFGEDERCVLGLAAQMAAVALRNAEVNALSAQVAVKEERNRLVEQLHDSVSQFVSAIQLMADTALNQMSSQPAQAVHWLKRIQHTARQAMAEVRINMFEMELYATGTHSLSQALLESATLAQNFGLTVDIPLQSIPEKLSIPIEEELLLICREALVNAARHADARQVTVKLTEANGMVRLQVQDDGQGFGLSDLSKPGVRGLKLMQQRIERMGGQLEIDSSPGEGTTVEAIIPA